jgi:hypothetical protein
MTEVEAALNPALASPQASKLLLAARRSKLLSDARKQRNEWIVGKPAEESAADAPVDVENDLKKVLEFLNTLAGPDDDANDGPIDYVHVTDTTKKLEVIAEEDEKFDQHWALFLEKLKHAECADIVSLCKQFVKGFNSRDLTEQHELDAAPEILWSFLSLMQARMRSHTLWRDENEEEWELSCMASERFLMEKVYKKIFTPTPELKEMDDALFIRIESLSFLNFEHLCDMKNAPGLKEKLAGAIKELGRINDICTVIGKMMCIIKVSHMISQALYEGQLETGSTSAIGADDFLPAFILAMLQVNPPHLESNLEYIQTFGTTENLRGETGYFFTHMYSSVCFLQNVDADQLSMTAEQFEQGLAETRAKMGSDEANSKEPPVDRLREGSIDQFNMEEQPDTVGSPPRNRKRSDSGHFNAGALLDLSKGQWLGPDVLAVRRMRVEREAKQSSEESANGGGATAAADATGRQQREQQEQQFRFLNATPSELQIADVPELLREYQALARQLMDMTKNGGGQPLQRQTVSVPAPAITLAAPPAPAVSVAAAAVPAAAPAAPARPPMTEL